MVDTDTMHGREMQGSDRSTDIFNQKKKNDVDISL